MGSLIMIGFIMPVGLGITFLIPRNLPGSERRVYELAYVASTLALNTIVTGMIATRLMVYRYRTNSVGGPLHSQGEGLQYVGIVAMLIESAALVVMFNAIFLATIPLNSFVYYVAFAGSAQAQVCLCVFRGVGTHSLMG